MKAAAALLFAALFASLFWWLGREDVAGATPQKKEALVKEQKASPDAELEAPPETLEPAPTDEPSESPLAAAEALEAQGRTEIARPDEPVLIFQHADHDREFPGRRWLLFTGEHVAPGAFENDEASTVRVPKGLRLELFDGHDFDGARLVLEEGQHNLSPYGFNDRASSARVTDAAVRLPGAFDAEKLEVVLFESRPGEEGRVWRLPLPPKGERVFHTSTNGLFDPFAISTVWVPQGVELTLFYEPDGRGRAMVLGAGEHHLDTVGFNDTTQSLYILVE